MAKISKIFISIFTHVGKNKIHVYDVHDALYQNSEIYELFFLNCEINGPWVRGFDHRAGQIGPDSKMY